MLESELIRPDITRSRPTIMLNHQALRLLLVGKHVPSPRPLAEDGNRPVAINPLTIRQLQEGTSTIFTGLVSVIAVPKDMVVSKEHLEDRKWYQPYTIFELTLLLPGMIVCDTELFPGWIAIVKHYMKLNQRGGKVWKNWVELWLKYKYGVYYEVKRNSNSLYVEFQKWNREAEEEYLNSSNRS